ncbi:MAG: hypothetical protein HC890_14590, partial [Chloroflexaceae bacterium]|nr:hypothetical protein [Chloroflexaceae bacterium]
MAISINPNGDRLHPGRWPAKPPTEVLFIDTEGLDRDAEAMYLDAEALFVNAEGLDRDAEGLFADAEA